jgi:phosphotransferase system enzyme I (PtsI)
MQASGADGIGLFRTEFMFMNRDTVPSEDEQFETIVEVVRAMKGALVTFRTLDIGGDKLIRSLGAHLSAAANPALGLRAIRLSLKEPHLLETQFRAILRAGYFGPVRILLPMVTTAAEVEQARRILKKCHAELKKEKIPLPDALPPLGTMIEIPAAALSADSLAAVSDFFALGTNDLIQYTVAIDRGNDQVAALFNPLNPAVLRLMEFSIQAGLRAGIPVSICGEMAADPKYTALLLGLGIREMSLGFASLPRIKQRIRALTLAKADEHARYVLDQYDPERIVQIVNGFRA